MKTKIIAICVLAASMLTVGCSERGESAPPKLEPVAAQPSEEPRKPYRRSAPPPVMAEEFNKAGMRGAGSPQAERK